MRIELMGLVAWTAWSAAGPLASLPSARYDAPAASPYEQRRTRGPVIAPRAALLDPKGSAASERRAIEAAAAEPSERAADEDEEATPFQETGPARPSLERARAICDALDDEELRTLEGQHDDRPWSRAAISARARTPPRSGPSSGARERGARAQILEALFAAADRKLAIPGTRPERWVARARASAALPVLSAGLDHRRDDGWNLDQSPGTAVELSSDVGTSRVIRSRATWELDRLIFNVDELRAARALLDLAELKERIHLSVASYYQERSDLRCRARLRREGLTPATTLDEELAERERVGWLESQILAWTGIELGTLPW